MTARCSIAAVLAFLAALVLSSANAWTVGRFMPYSDGRTGLLPQLFLPVILCSMLSVIFGALVTRSTVSHCRRWATIGSLCVVVPAAVPFGGMTLFAVLSIPTSPNPVGSVVTAASPVVSAATVVVLTALLGRPMSPWLRCCGLVVASAVPVLLAVARVLLVP